MRPYTGSYTEQRKNGRCNFTYYAFTPHPLKDATLFKIENEVDALLIEMHHNLGQLEGLIQYSPNKNSFCELIFWKNASIPE